MLFILCCSLVSSASFEFSQDDYASFETVLVKVNFTEDVVSLSEINVNVKDVNVVGEKVVKVDDGYYVSFYLPSVADGTYEFKLEQVKVRDDGLQFKEFSKTFDVVTRDAISIRPGLIYLDLNEFDQPRLRFDIENKGGLVDFVLGGSSWMELSEESFKLNPGNKRSVTVGTRIRKSNESLLVGSFYVGYGTMSYSVPVILKRDVKVVVEEENVTNETVNVPSSPGVLEFDVVKNGGDKIDLVLGSDELKGGDMYFKNSGGSALDNLTFVLEGLDVVSYTYSGDGVLDAGEVEFVHIDVNLEKNLTKDYSGVLKVCSGELCSLLPITVKLRAEEEVVEPVVPIAPVAPPVVDEVEEEGISKWWIVFVILLVFVVVFIVIYMKGRKERKSFEGYVGNISR